MTWLGKAAAILAAPFTGGASLQYLPMANQFDQARTKSALEGGNENLMTTATNTAMKQVPGNKANGLIPGMGQDNGQLNAPQNSAIDQPGRFNLFSPSTWSLPGFWHGGIPNAGKPAIISDAATGEATGTMNEIGPEKIVPMYGDKSQPQTRINGEKVKTHYIFGQAAPAGETHAYGNPNAKMVKAYDGYGNKSVVPAYDYTDSQNVSVLDDALSPLIKTPNITQPAMTGNPQRVETGDGQNLSTGIKTPLNQSNAGISSSPILNMSNDQNKRTDTATPQVFGANSKNTKQTQDDITKDTGKQTNATQTGYTNKYDLGSFFSNPSNLVEGLARIAGYYGDARRAYWGLGKSPLTTFSDWIDTQRARQQQTDTRNMLYAAREGTLVPVRNPQTGEDEWVAVNKATGASTNTGLDVGNRPATNRATGSVSRGTKPPSVSAAENSLKTWYQGGQGLMGGTTAVTTRIADPSVKASDLINEYRQLANRQGLKEYSTMLPEVKTQLSNNPDLAKKFALEYKAKNPNSTPQDAKKAFMDALNV